MRTLPGTVRRELDELTSLGANSEPIGDHGEPPDVDGARCVRAREVERLGREGLRLRVASGERCDTGDGHQRGYQRLEILDLSCPCERAHTVLERAFQVAAGKAQLGTPHVEREAPCSAGSARSRQ